MRRCLSLFGINDAAARDALDVATTALGADLDLTPGSVEVSGARNDDGVLALTIRGDGVRPEHVFRAALQHGNDEILRLIDILDADIPLPLPACSPAAGPACLRFALHAAKPSRACASPHAAKTPRKAQPCSLPACSPQPPPKHRPNRRRQK
ncbi:hypothetical protein [Ornithinimicrobium sp. INDO-MA30-4]|uniref:hypothetical protein n=1 Tax=Ornithinimicrobium sp. INDO-MA30-4 TaxID=2908651 RepID=UPI001F1BC19E|nr:hypothetical protein [Ornithinimicrobium sp. INDO-MA30-4]UJH69999.1 hypothetical protein L0A91_12345 [Ornithinimicrobium sp. INDO-MA30-4]